MKADWSINTEGLVEFKVPSSVDNVGDLSNPGILREYRARWEGARLVLPPDRFVHLVEAVAHLAADHLAEGDLSSGGALRWARGRIPLLVAAGLARYTPTGGLEPVA